MGAEKPRIVVIAGPNGAGKTTFAREFLPQEAGILHFINSDLIARGLSPLNPALATVKASRLMSQAIDEHIAKRESFAFETTLAGLLYAKHIPVWRALGFTVELYFLSLASPELAVARVKLRGDEPDMPENIWRRYAAGIDHLQRYYRDIVDVCWRFDTSPGMPMTERGRPSTSATDALRRAFAHARQSARHSQSKLAISVNGQLQELAADDPYFSSSHSP